MNPPHPALAQDLEDLVPDFLLKRKKDVEEIAKRLVRQDMRSLEEIGKLGHSMKGSGGSDGFDQVSKIGKAICDAVKENDRKTIETLNKALSEYLSMVGVALRRQKHKKVHEQRTP